MLVLSRPAAVPGSFVQIGGDAHHRSTNSFLVIRDFGFDLYPLRVGVGPKMIVGISELPMKSPDLHGKPMQHTVDL